MSIVNCVNNWYFSCVLITINLGDNHLSICGLLIKKSFIMSRKRWRIDTVWCCTWWQDQNCDELECSKNQAILLLFYKLQSVWAYYLRYHLRVQLVLLRFFFCSTLITFGFDIMYPRAIRSRHNIRWYGQDSTRYCWVLLSVILFANQNFLDDFSNWL